MAENQNNDEKDKKDKDPFDFFKLSIDNPDDKDKKGRNPKGPKKRLPFWIVALMLFIGIVVFNVFSMVKNDRTIEFSEFKKFIEDGVIVQVVLQDDYFIGYTTIIDENSSYDDLKGVVKSEKAGQKTVYKTAAIWTNDFIEFLDEHNVVYKAQAKQNNYFLRLVLEWVLPFALIYLMWFFIMRKVGGGGAGFGSIFNAGQSKNAAVEEGKVKTRFSDVAGVDEAKEELVEVVDFLKEPKKYTDIGGKIPKGVLLVGPPGTGKTLLARAVAGEAGVPFFRISGSDFVEMFVGVGASRVRDLFKQAREKAPCIVFIDEIDALGKNRMSGYGGGNDEREQTLNQLLVEMDGFDNEKGLIILAATNRADILDPALLRPGRFDRHVPVEKPDVKGREEILRIHAKNVKLDSDVNFESIAHGTTGFAGADLANVVNEAALLAVRNGRKKVTMADFNDAIDKVSIGLKKKTRKENEKEMRLVSVHETGHALVGAFTPNYPPVNKITVVPRSHGVGGFTQYREQEEKNFQTKQDMLDEIDTLLGGRAAEQIILGEISTGASNDIARATDILKSMIVDFGMSDKFKNMTLGKGVLGSRGGEPNLIREFSEETQKFIDEEIARVMDERYQHVLSVLEGHKDLLEYIAKRLLEIETMEGKEFYEIVENAKRCEKLMIEAKDDQNSEKSEEKNGENRDSAEKANSEEASSDEGKKES
ncbi:MAG: ATP-dependent zinc metalloprotease FtsH [Treponemataceae bacterium]|nr:ATP-dependent zinc metalloprotease FtsH [Spirochaetales bacterium]MDY6032037.1 ATP-dependent zinc metalloprotease FtsH [Treponemataceae bacterium]